MKILIITQYFYPENLRINDLVFSLKNRGYSIEVFTGKPNYPKGEYFEGYSWSGPKEELIQGIKINRCNQTLRKNGGSIRLFFNYLSFVFFGIFKLFKMSSKFDKVFVYAPSPITVGILGILAAKKFKCKSYLWVHDLWPESVRIAGGISNNIILNIINYMTKTIYRYSDVILIQSPEFKKYLKKQNVSSKKMIYYPYYAEDFYKVVKVEKKIKKIFPKGFNLIFAGNIGVAQSFDTIIKAFELLKDENINLIVLGEGRDKQRVTKIIKEKGISNKFYFLGSYPPEKIPYYFACADSLLITLKKADIFSYTIPGKLQSYLACGKPIIGSLDGIGRKIISESKSGLCSASEDANKLSKNILSMYKLSIEERNLFGRNAIDYFNKNFNKKYLIEKFETLIKI